MRDLIESIASRLRLWSPAMFASAAVYLLGALVALVMLIVRSSVVGDTGLSSGSQAILILVSWLVACYVVRESCSSQKIWRWIPNVCSGLITVALMSWSVSVPVALAVAMPILLATIGSAVFEFMDWQTMPGLPGEQPIRRSSVASELAASTETRAVSDSAPATIESAVSPPDDIEDEGSDLWESVQREFTADSNLTHNVARWTSEDGQQTLVANIRCHLQPGSRTATIQLPVWPFLPGTPEVFCRVIDGGASEVRVTQNRPNGIAAEVTWPNKNTSELPESAVIEVVAMASASQALSDVAA